MPGFNIAILGAGPAGCTLARLLLMHNPEPSNSSSSTTSTTTVTIYEREPSATSRAQGGTLDLHTSDGLAALKAAGLYPQFLKHARFDGEAIKITDKKLKAYVNLNGAGSAATSNGRPEIDRAQLRALLLESLPEGVVRWGCRVEAVEDARDAGEEVSETGGLHVRLVDGSVHGGFDLVVAADGARSCVRGLLGMDPPYFTGVIGASLTLKDVATQHPELYKLVNRGSLFAFSDGKAVSAQQLGSGDLHVGYWSVGHEDWRQTCGYDSRNGAAVKRAALDELKAGGWDARLVRFVEEAEDGDAVVRPLYMLPIGQRWKSMPGLTAIGDAAHLMSPFAGEGVNLAMSDSLKLAHAIFAAEKDANGDSRSERRGEARKKLYELVAAFEEDMMKRAQLSQVASYENMKDMFFVPGAPRTVIERHVIRAITLESNAFVTAIATFCVYVFFWFFKLIY
eukprot:TRINITY_DN15012_c0_g2_i1.p1 TRINITY_DN15012_c0_g2~~TRINITY_DN15012_c0_g2_i1.p1  ORF type:complete len:453 (-),score=78.00 TRINITY_DN15012_c0_g2_i1:885-2243(-)